MSKRKRKQPHKPPSGLPADFNALQNLIITANPKTRRMMTNGLTSVRFDLARCPSGAMRQVVSPLAMAKDEAQRALAAIFRACGTRDGAAMVLGVPPRTVSHWRDGRLRDSSALSLISQTAALLGVWPPKGHKKPPIVG